MTGTLCCKRHRDLRCVGVGIVLAARGRGSVVVAARRTSRCRVPGRHDRGARRRPPCISCLRCWPSSPRTRRSPGATSLRQVFASGEALPGTAGCGFAGCCPPPALHNLYGPTEAAVDVTFHEASDSDMGSVPIGRPVWNTCAYVLDARLHPVPVGVVGEFYRRASAGARVPHQGRSHLRTVRGRPVRGLPGRPDVSHRRLGALERGR